jgi:hypothetical protein
MTTQQVRGIIEGGKFREVPGRQNHHAASGTFALQTATNAAPIYLPDGSVAQNYTGDPTMGAPAPTIGGAGMAVTNAPTAAPAQTPAPSPTPYPVRAPTIRQQRAMDFFTEVVNGIPVQLIPGP